MINKLKHPIKTLDRWWVVQAPVHRLDRGPMYLVVMVPVWLYALSILLVGPVPNSAVDELPNFIQYTLATVIFAGTTGQLYGSLLGSKILKPNFDIRRCYRVGYSAAPMTAAGLIAYGWAVVNDTPNWTSAFGGLIGPAIGVGALLNALGFWLEVRRLDRGMKIAVDIKKDNSNGSD